MWATIAYMGSGREGDKDFSTASSPPGRHGTSERHPRGISFAHSEWIGRTKIQTFHLSLRWPSRPKKKSWNSGSELSFGELLILGSKSRARMTAARAWQRTQGRCKLRPCDLAGQGSLICLIPLKKQNSCSDRTPFFNQQGKTHIF